MSAGDEHPEHVDSPATDTRPLSVLPAPPAGLLPPGPPPVRPGPHSRHGLAVPVRAAPTLTVLPALTVFPAPSSLTSSGHPALPHRTVTGPVVGNGNRAVSSARNASVMAAGTVLSRLSGFARLLAIGWVLGQGRLADAYNQANTIPNTIYELLLGGVLSATLLPVLMQSLSRNNAAEDDEAVPAVISFLTVALLAGTLVFWVAAPAIVHLFLLRASGPGAAGEKALATTWLRLFTPQLLFMGLIAITTALLNARRRFASVAFSPVLANIVTIVALVVADHVIRHPSVSAYRADATAIAIVGIGTTAGYLMQLVAQLPALLRAGIPLHPRWDPTHPSLRAIGRLSGWTFGVVVANQISYSLVSVLANSKAGNFSAFSYSYAFMLLPYAVVAVSVAYAVAPDLAQRWSEGDRDEFAKGTSSAMRVTLALLLPAGVGYALLARPAVVLALAHGNESVGSAHLVGSLLAIFALGLPGFSLYFLIMRAFQSKQDTRSMFMIYLFENALTVVAALALYPVFGVRGLTAAWIGSYTVALPFAWWHLHKSAPIIITARWWTSMAAATGIMAVVVVGVLRLVPAPHSLPWSVARLCVVIAVGAAVFIAAARALAIKELTDLTARYRSVVH